MIVSVCVYKNRNQRCEQNACKQCYYLKHQHLQPFEQCLQAPDERCLQKHYRISQLRSDLYLKFLGIYMGLKKLHNFAVTDSQQGMRKECHHRF